MQPPPSPPPGAAPDPNRTHLFSSRSDIETGAVGDADQSTSETPLPLPDPQVFGRYRVTREVARGGMGVIYAGRDPELDRDVAIKVLRDIHQSKPAYRKQLLEEARITGRLQHPGVIPVYEFGEAEGGRPYFVMRFVDGQTLESLLVARRSLVEDLPRMLKVFERVCQAVAYAHSRGVVHLDLKPLNVMVAPFGVVKVMDWGVARVLEEEGDADPPPASLPPVAADSEAVPVLGTPAYMSPEQANGRTAAFDRRTDVFGIGGILCTILTGFPPYPGNHTRQVCKNAARADLAGAFERLDAAPVARELVGLARACLSADPDARPRDAIEVAAILTAYLESDLRRAERDLVRFFELTPDLFCIAGTDGYFRRVNENFTRVLGYSPEELISRPFVEFVHPDDRSSTVHAAEQLGRGLPLVRFRNRYRDVAGRYRWFEWAAKSIPEEGIIFAVARDITDQVGPDPAG